MWQQALDAAPLSDEEWKDALQDAFNNKPDKHRFRILLDCQLRSRVLLKMSDTVIFKCDKENEEDSI